MIFSGLQKLTLLDFPEHTACTLFTAGCNFRCPFCHNAALVTHIDTEYRVTEEEVLSFLTKRQGILDGVAITGGEPLMHPELGDFIKKVKDLGFAVKLDTNGTFPDRLIALCEAGLIDYVAVDIKNSREKYTQTAGVDNLDLDKLQQTIDFLKKGTVPYEFRTTVVRELHTLQDIEDIGAWIRGADNWFLQNFVDSGDLISQNLNAHDRETLQNMLAIAAVSACHAGLRGI